MGYRVLITMDLPSSFEENRFLFYQELTNRKWYKIKTLTTAWTVSFPDIVTRKKALIDLINDIDQAKTISKIDKVEYAFQLGLGEVVVGHDPISG